MTRPLGPIRVGLALLAGFALAGCDGNAAGTAYELPDYQADAAFGPAWMQLIAAARPEGEVVIILSASRSRDHRAIFDAFSRKFGIEVVAGSGSADANVQRVLAERARGRFTADVSLVSTSQSERLRRSGALVPLEVEFVHPEVADRSHGWIHDRPDWLDAAEGYVAAYKIYVRENITDIYYNTDEVSEEEIASVRSFSDFLDPRWRGRIVAVMDPNGHTTTAHIRTPWVVLGRDWFNAFVRTQQPTLLPDTALRELSDGMARGKYHVSLFAMSAAEQDMDRMAAFGLPVRKLKRTLDEGMSLTLGGGIAMLDRAPHPNAARLFVNWYLSREGQSTYQQLVDSVDPSPSLRTDVVQGRVSDHDWSIVRNLDDYSVIERDPELAFEQNVASVAFVKEICAELGCYGY